MSDPLDFLDSAVDPRTEECAALADVLKNSVALVVSLATDDKNFECPDCGLPMNLRKNKTSGESFYSCSGFTEKTCKKTVGIEYFLPLKIDCEKCGLPMRLLKNRKDKSSFYGCAGYKNKDNPCKHTIAIK